MKVVWTPQAVEDLKAIVRFISKNNPETARRFADKLKRRAESVGRFPGRGRMVPEIGNQEIREIIAGNFRIVFRIRPKTVEILTMFEGHMIFQDRDSQD